MLVLLGPNGAGKTSTVETLEGYRRPAAGEVRVLGLDPIADHAALSGRIGVMLQRGGVYPMLGPRRVLDLFAGYYAEPVPADELLDLVGLRAVAGTPWRHLSGGEQQRLSLALALVGRPEVAFLDEPTAGVDPEGRIAVRAVVAGLKERGVCVVLTTHELGEAEKMADRIVILSAGRVVLEGTPQGLTAETAPGIVTFGAPPALDVAALAAAVGPGAMVRRRRRAATGSRPRSRDPGRHRRRGQLPGGPWRHPHRPGDGQDPRGRLLRDGGGGRPGRPRRDAGRRRAPGAATRPVSTTAGALRPLRAQTSAEVFMTLRRGETLLLTLGIPVVFLLFFSKVSVVSTPTATPANFFVPGILALAVMSTSMVSLGIATGFERGYGVLKRLGATPLGRPRLLGAKILTIVAVELRAGRRPAAGGARPGLEPGRRRPGRGGRSHRCRAARLGRLRRHRPLHGRHAAGRGEPGRGQRPLPHPPAAGRHDRPAGKLPSGLANFAKLLPAEALSSALHATLGSGSAVPAESWIVLAVWAVAAPLAAALTFRWE